MRGLIHAWRLPRPRFSLRMMLLFVVPAIAVATVTTHSVAKMTGLLKPPRPMYCNVYSTHHRGESFPYWKPDCEVYDDQSCDGWVDLEDNALLIAIPAQAKPSYQIDPGVRSSDVVRRENGTIAGVVTTLKRKKNVVVIVRSDGKTIEFEIEEAAAVSFYAENSIQSGSLCPSLIEAARGIVAEDDIFEFEEFVSLPFDGVGSDHPAADFASASNTNSSPR